MKLTSTDFHDLFGESLTKRSAPLVDKYNFSYQLLSGKERDSVVIDILNAFDRGFTKTGDVNKREIGWRENLDRFVESGNIDDLTPHYYKRNPLRLRGEFILPDDATFEVSFFDVLRTWVAEKFLSSVKNVYEFGCGPAHNLISFQKLHPEKRYVGLDWAKSSQEIIEAINIDSISGMKFDMLSPPDFNIKPDSAVVTIGALEQLSNKFEPMVDYWLKQPVSIFVHLEPIIEFYEDNLLDYLAKKFTEEREYLNGYLTHLRKRKEIEITTATRVRFGSLFHEGWNLIVWRKTN